MEVKMNWKKTIIGGILFLAGIGESWKAIYTPYALLEILVVILLTLGAGYILYSGIND